MAVLSLKKLGINFSRRRRLEREKDDQVQATHDCGGLRGDLVRPKHQRLRGLTWQWVIQPFPSRLTGCGERTLRMTIPPLATPYSRRGQVFLP